jgi:hypothetical protein
LLDLMGSRDDSCPPRLITDDQVREIPDDEFASWKEEAKLVAVSGYHFVFDDGPDISDSSDEGSMPDELEDMYAPGCSQGDAQLGRLEAFILRKASQGDPELSQLFKKGQEAKAQCRGPGQILSPLFRGICAPSQRDY